MIGRIKNKYARRLTIALAVVPFLLLAIVVGAGLGAAEWVSDMLSAIRAAWRGDR